MASRMPRMSLASSHHGGCVRYPAISIVARSVAHAAARKEQRRVAIGNEHRQTSVQTQEPAEGKLDVLAVGEKLPQWIAGADQKGKLLPIANAEPSIQALRPTVPPVVFLCFGERDNQIARVRMNYSGHRDDPNQKVKAVVIRIGEHREEKYPEAGLPGRALTDVDRTLFVQCRDQIGRGEARSENDGKTCAKQ